MFNIVWDWSSLFEEVLDNVDIDLVASAGIYYFSMICYSIENDELST
jgi:hypothetical protein